MALLVASRGAAVEACPAAARGPSIAQVQVMGAGDRDLPDICRGVQSAIAFFAGHGVPMPDPVVIEVTSKLPVESTSTAVGCFVAQERRVYLLPYAQLRSLGSWMNVPIDRALYRALVAHEAAHAIAARSFLVPNPSVQAVEYLAYVAMFASMPSDLRARVLRATPSAGLDAFETMARPLYLFEPTRFGVLAYRHFDSSRDRRGLLLSVLAGSRLAE